MLNRYVHLCDFLHIGSNKKRDLVVCAAHLGRIEGQGGAMGARFGPRLI